MQLGKKLWKLTEQLIKDRVGKNDEHHDGVRNANVEEAEDGKYDDT